MSVSGVPIYHGLGNLTTDPVSGTLKSSIYLQVIPPSNGFKFPKEPDSAVLILPYGGFTWGDTLSTIGQTFRVYEVTEPLSKDSTYYTFTEKTVGNVELSDNPQPVTHESVKNSITVNGISRAAHLRIPLTPDFKNRIYSEATNGSGLNTSVDFLQYFKGLYITADPSQAGAAIYYFLLNGGSDFTRANIQFYYTEKTSSNQDTVKYTSFYFDQSVGAHYNKIEREITQGLTYNLLGSNLPSDSVIVIQNEPGAVLDIRMPFVKHLPKQPIIKAELVITQELPNAEDAKYWAPQRLFPVGVYNRGGTYTIQDRYPLNSSEPLVFIDGRRRDVTINGSTHSQYVINIPRELQKAIVEQRDTLHLRINGATQFPGAYRLIGGGRKTSGATGVKLNIVYSKI